MKISFSGEMRLIASQNESRFFSTSGRSCSEGLKRFFFE
jgi:hypothetical protein